MSVFGHSTRVRGSSLAMLGAVALGGCTLFAPLEAVNQSASSDAGPTSGTSGGTSSTGNPSTGSDGGQGSGDGGTTRPGGSSSSGDSSGGADAGGEGPGGASAGSGNGGDSGGVGSGGASDTETCEDDGGRCVSVPDGWDGPILLLRGSEEELRGGCPAPLEEVGLEVLHVGPIAAAALCDACTCGDATGCSLTVRPNLTSSCPGSPGPPESLEIGECLNLTLGSDVAITFDGVTQDSEIQCGAGSGGGVSVLAPVVWQDSFLACSQEVGPEGACGAGSCLPRDVSQTQGLDGKACIYARGTQECPNGYPEEQLWYEDYSDTRDCSPCTCRPTGDCRGPDVVVGYSGSGCVGFEAGISWPECVDSTPPPMPPCECQSVSAAMDVGSVRYEPSAACDPTGGDAFGDVTEDPATAVTVCCER